MLSQPPRGFLASSLFISEQRMGRLHPAPAGKTRGGSFLEQEQAYSVCLVRTRRQVGSFPHAAVPGRAVRGVFSHLSAVVILTDSRVPRVPRMPDTSLAPLAHILAPLIGSVLKWGFVRTPRLFHPNSSGWR